MTEQFDVVHKAKHYNTHPSGIEAKHILRWLNFNMGNVLKYAMRRHGKEYDRSLKSSEFYLRDQMEHSPTAVLHPDFFQLFGTYIQHEPEPLAKTFYERVLDYIIDPQAAKMDEAIAALTELRVSGR